MKKFFLTILTAVMASSASFGQYAMSNLTYFPTQQFKTWNSQYYTIKYPADWKLLTDFDELTDVYIGSLDVYLGFTVLFGDTEFSLSEVVNMGNVDLNNAGMNVVSNKLITINGQPCYKTIIEFWANGSHIKQISYTFKKGMRIFNVKFGNSYSEVNANTALIDEIIGSFKMK